MTNSNREGDEEDEITQDAESDMFTNALLNGDEKLNRVVKLVDTRMNSQARRTNKLRAEVRERDESLRRDLAPVILAAKIFPALGGVGTLATLVYVAHSIGAI